MGPVKGQSGRSGWAQKGPFCADGVKTCPSSRSSLPRYGAGLRVPGNTGDPRLRARRSTFAPSPGGPWITPFLSSCPLPAGSFSFCPAEGCRLRLFAGDRVPATDSSGARAGKASGKGGRDWPGRRTPFGTATIPPLTATGAASHPRHRKTWAGRTPVPGLEMRTSSHSPCFALVTPLHHEQRAFMSSENRCSRTARRASWLSPEPARTIGGCRLLIAVASD